MAFEIVGTATYVPVKREKHTISADPNNKFWENDKNKFGMKMMMKMGWSEGKGLGKNEDGRADYIKPTVNTTKSGLGSDLDTSKNWLASSSEFNNVLAALNSKYNSTKPNEQNSTTESQSRKPKHLISATKRQKAKCVNNYKKEDIAAILGTAPPPPQPFEAISFFGGDNLHCLTSLVARDCIIWEEPEPTPEEPHSPKDTTASKQIVEESGETSFQQHKKKKRKSHDTNETQMPNEQMQQKKKKKQKRQNVEDIITE